MFSVDTSATELLADAVERILQTTDLAPSKVHATFVYVESSNGSEDLVPVINIEWQKK
jgi:hypothetical protein